MDSSAQNKFGERLATGLGWFSIGLGVAELVAPQSLAKFIGIRPGDRTPGVMRFNGVREIAAGVGILSQRRNAGWLWARVAGDALDLASLGKGLASDSANRGRLASATAAVVGVTALDVIGARNLRASGANQNGSDLRVTRTIIINRSPEEVYRFWRNPENLAASTARLASVHSTGERRSHWTASGPAGKQIQWDATITGDQPDRLISWQTEEGSDITHSGTVRFERAPGGRGTLVRVEFQLEPQGLTALFAPVKNLIPGAQIENALRGVKQILETGEVVQSDASMHAGLHAARPTVAA